MTPQREHLVAAGIKDPDTWLPVVQKALGKHGIESNRQVAAWLAQTAHESAGYTVLAENLNYSAQGLAATWPNRFAEQAPDPARPGKTRPKKDAKGLNVPNRFAVALHRQPKAIADVVYSGRMGNGPIESGDGSLFLGRGLKQLTGRENVTRCAAALGVDFVSNPDLLLEPRYAALSAAWFWTDKKCGLLADADDFKALTVRINGGLIGIEDRTRRYRAVLATMTD